MDGIKYQLAVISDQLAVHAGWFSWAFTGGCLDRITGLRDLWVCYNSHPVHPVTFLYAII